MNHLTVRLYDSFGCTIVATALLQSLRNAFPEWQIDAYTKNLDLLEGLAEIDNVYDVSKRTLPKYDIDISTYLEDRKPQENQPLRHLYKHMLEAATEQLGDRLKEPLKGSFVPKVNFQTSELEWAQKVIKDISPDKPLLWLQTKTRSSKKDWKDEYWEELKELLKDRFNIIDLSECQSSKREAMAITKYCAAGITLDTFLLHGSEAVEAKNTLVILVSSHPEVVCYKDQVVLNGLQNGIRPKDVMKALDGIKF